MSFMKKTNLIKLYCAVCDHYSTVAHLAQRTSNNSRPKFSDEECITAYFWGLSTGFTRQKSIWQFTRDYLSEWFPNLPSYQAFNRRLNFLSEVLRSLAEALMDQVSALGGDEGTFAVDSCPVMLATRSRSSRARVAGECCSKSYNSTRKEWYYGVKLHAFVATHAGSLAKPCALMASTASDHDLPVARRVMEECQPFRGGRLYADKAYVDSSWREELSLRHGVTLLTPRKKIKGEVVNSGDAYSSWVSSMRQPVEGFFSWLDAKNGIQDASLVRSTQGLLVHIYGRIGVAMYGLLSNP